MIEQPSGERLQALRNEIVGGWNPAINEDGIRKLAENESQFGARAIVWALSVIDRHIEEPRPVAEELAMAIVRKRLESQATWLLIARAVGTQDAGEMLEALGWANDRD